MRRPLHVLIVVDSIDGPEPLLSGLRAAGYEPTFAKVNTLAGMEAALDQQEWEVVIADVPLADFSAPSALGLLKERGRDLPLIIVTGQVSEDVAVAAIKDGAADYLLKDRLVRLGPAVAQAIEHKRLREEKRLADQRLRDSEKRFRALIENSSDFMALVTSDGMIFDTGLATRGALGYEPQCLIGRDILEIVHPRDRACVKDLLAEVVREPGKTARVQCQARHQDGSWRWFECSGTNLLEEPSVRAVVINYRDITEGLRAEQALRESEERYRQMFEKNQAVKWLIDPQTGRIVEANLPAAKLYGYSVEELQRMKVSDINILTEEQVAEEIAQAAREERTVFHFRHRLASGEVRDVEVYSSPIDVRGCKLLYSVILDITDRKRAEQALRESERRLRLIAENTSDVIMAYDMDRRLIYINPAVEQQTGYSVEELRRQDFIKWVHPEDEARMMQFWEGIYQGRGFVNEEFRILTKQGEVKWVLASWGPLYDESGRQVGVQGREQDITARKRMEEALRESEASLGRAQQIARLGNWDQNLLTDELRWSDEIYRIFGLTPQEFTPTSEGFFRLVHPEDVGTVRRAVEESFREEKPYSIDHRIVRPDGSVRIVHEQAELSFDEQGRAAHLLGTVQDITERKRVEQALHESEERFRTAFTHAMIGFALAGPDGRFLQVNRSFCEMLGYTEQELLPLGFQDITHPDDLGRSLEMVGRLIAGEFHSFQMEKRYLHRNGSVVWGQLSVSLVRDASGQPLQCVVEVEDITERKRVQEELRKSEERYRDLFENANDILYTHDLEGNFTSINKAGEQLTGYTRAETLGLNISQIVAPEHLAHARANIFSKMSSGGGETTYELEILRKDGSRVPVEVHTRLIYHGDRPAGVQGIARDISERKRAEAERRRLEEQLFQAQKMESIGTLAGGVAHDFNNLLTAILGNTQLALARLQPSDPLHRRLLEIAKAANRAASLTGQLLAFSRRQRLERKTIDLNETLSEFMKMLRRIIGADVEVCAATAPDLPPIFADPAQIEQVVMNLAVNARDAMPSGGRILIETRRAQLDEAFCHKHPWARPGDYVRLVVSDTGCGMDTETQQRIFEPFFTTKGIGKGTGLGLAVAFGIVQQHDGLIHVSSEVGRGTTFSIYLPVAEPAAAEEGAAAQPEMRGGRETILVGEDEESLRELTHEVLTGLGYTVLLAKDGKEAVEMYTAHREEVELVLLDLVMPRMGGQEAYRLMCELRRDLPALFMTGYSVGAASGQPSTESGVALIQKPYSVDELGRRVREALDRAEGPGSRGPELAASR